jgi:hypothetical protein
MKRHAYYRLFLGIAVRMFYNDHHPRIFTFDIRGFVPAF